jgi:hypothetical protein
MPVSDTVSRTVGPTAAARTETDPPCGYGDASVSAPPK